MLPGPRDSLLLPPEPSQPRNPTSLQLPSLSQQHPVAQDGAISQLQSSLQSQLHVHSQILEEQRQEIENQRHQIARMDSTIEALRHEQRNIYAVVDEVRHELRARGSAPEHHHPDTSEPLDILTQEVQHISAKTNEIHGLKMQLDILRSQVRRLEQVRHGSPGANGAPASEPLSHEQASHAPAGFATNTPSAPEQRPLLYQTPIENRLPAPIAANPELPDPRVQPESRTLPGIRSIDPNTPLSSWRPAGAIAPPPSMPMVGSSPQIEAPAPGSGWAAVNTNTAPKRLISEPSFESTTPGSPKRQRLAPLMPRTFDQQSPAQGSSPYHSVSGDSLPTVPTLQSTQNPSNESTGSVPPQPNPLRFVQFASGLESTSEESWRQGPGSAIDRTRGSPRRGRGGRSRGGRRSGGAEGDRATPEWEARPDNVQILNPPEGHGGPVQASEQPGETTAGMYPDPHFMPITTTADVASSNHPTKKTRTKPVRNADGVLIRKDGRPDMRSVSSAMNLKKVHAKKEAERAHNKENSAASEDTKDKTTPYSASEHDAGETSAASPSVDGHATDGENNTLDRHQETMRKVFPHGIDNPSVQSMAQQFFPKPDDICAAPQVKIEAMVESDTTTKEAPRGHDGPKPLIDGERSMVHHTAGRVDVEMNDAK
ncbi:hypothetical protein E4T52_13497 [Aureobasidium sp. EXF-3400]|nr:hypothetical protein E4T51_14492 [Aureobasidium sp. EXF-12344]KAI4771501.1 hypothetical protein E4T52_13497 [Aureobasidium sp. EXF-3400]